MKIVNLSLAAAGFSLLAGGAFAEAHMAAVGTTAITEHAGVDSLEDLIGATVTDLDGNELGVIDHFNVVGEAIWAIVERPDGSQYAHEMTRMRYSDAGYVSEDQNPAAFARPGVQ